MGKFVKTRQGQPSLPSCVGLIGDEGFLQSFPAIAEYLTLTINEETKKKRETSTITMFIQNSMFTICLNDRDTKLVTFVSARTFRDAFQALEENLAEDTAEWRLTGGGRR